MSSDKNDEIIKEIFSGQATDSKGSQKELYQGLNLTFNPFPRSGTSNINGSDLYNRQLLPVDDGVMREIIDFIAHAFRPNELNPDDQFISATITGDYGSGKTQLLMFIRSLLGEVAAQHRGNRTPYVIYIDNPGVKLMELIGAIISKIGEEDFKKFIWNKIINKIKSDQSLRQELAKYESKGSALFSNIDPDPYADINSVSYKKFLGAFVGYINNAKQRKEFEKSFKEVLIRVLEDEIGNPTLAQYFYQLISEDYGVNKTWEALSSGSIKQLDNKEAEIIKYIVELIKEQGYTDFFILVDEFEDITEGRLSKAQVDNYIYNLRTLLDEHRSWCLIFAMTGQALKKLRSVSPPLADRIGTRLILLQDLNLDQAKKVLLNHLNLARDSESLELTPFEESGIKKLNELVEGNARKFLKNCFLLVEKAVEKKADLIDSDFVTQNFSKEII